MLRVDGNAAYWPGANRLFTSSRSSLNILRLPDESLGGSPKRSTFDFFRDFNVAGEEDRELELDSCMMIVDETGSSLVELVADKLVDGK